MTILICPLSQAAALARRRAPGRGISLLDPETPFPDLSGLGAETHLKLSLHDIDAEQSGLRAPCDRIVGAMIGFVETWDRAAPLLVHCYAGISRSTATAFIAACVHNAGTDEEEIALALRRASPTATPNKRIVAIADATLGRGGRMSRAAAAIGRGAPSWPDIAEADPFELMSDFQRA